MDMRWRGLALVSFGVNVLLAAGWWGFAHRQGERHPPQSVASNAVAGVVTSTNVVVRREFFTWQEIESEDYPTYIANLRDIGCPEQTVRDIIVADVNALYARRRAIEILTPFQQWWRSSPDVNVARTAARKIRELDEERISLLASLLGTNWETGDMLSLPRPSREGLVLDGPQLGALPTEVKEALQEISRRSEDRMKDYLASHKPPDPAEVARLRQQTREELAGALSPAQLEEFLLRYSQYSSQLRSEFGSLRYFNVTPDEFRAVFRSTDGIDQQIELLAGNDPNTVRQRNILEQSREDAIKDALGAKRYQEYRLLQDPLYRQAMAQAIEAGTPEAAGAIYGINLAAQAEKNTITSDATLSEQQRTIELRELELNQLKANTVASGGELPPDAPVPSPAVPVRTYTLLPGDTPAVISMIYGVPVSALRQANPRLNLNKLRAGDSLIIPPIQTGPYGGP